MMEKMERYNPYHIAFMLNKTERQGNLGAPMDLFLQRPLRSVPPNSQNVFQKLAENEGARSYMVQADDGKTYLRNSRFLSRTQGTERRKQWIEHT